MSRPSEATFRRRRAVALGALAALVALPVFALTRGDDPDPARSPAVTAAKRPAAPKPRTDLAAIAARANVPVLCYHQIRPLTSADAAQDRVYIVPPKRLDAQLTAMQRAGYTAVSAHDVAAHMAEGRRLPPKPFLITFDDASEGQYKRALPILRRHKLKATFFVMTVVLGKPGWLTKGQVRALDRGGMEIGLHTWDHHAVPDYDDAAWTTQLTEPKAELEEIVGHRLDVFAYPFGLLNAAAFPRLQEAGVRIAFQLADKLDPEAPMLTTRRILVGPDVSGNELLGMVRQDF